MTLNEYFRFLIRSISVITLLVSTVVDVGYAQHHTSKYRFIPYNYSFNKLGSDTTSLESQFPPPKKVLKQSLIIPGWGQVTNKQAWKVPIVYGIIGGLTYYSIYLHKKYHDYRAAYYNLNPDTPDDNKFGMTPGYIPENASLSALEQNRNFFRNRRDLVYVFVGLSYALNAIDAYVFAHLRSFDVSDDLSMRIGLDTDLIAVGHTSSTPSISLSINF